MGTDDDQAQQRRARTIELYLASDDRPADDQVFSLVMAGVRVTADMFCGTGYPVPPSVAEAVDDPAPTDPRAGAWSAVSARLAGDHAGCRAAVLGVQHEHGSEGLTTAVGYLARLYRDARDGEAGAGIGRHRRTGTAGGEPA
ncbi:hypothetical protein [Amycolatopsis sp. CA-128772]|uniref:hypothetical protein n=1 Tax=Amycolatopsis sp. CA-128772 TaxID=2073159 RepID=UPI000CD12DCD|nr:hypothetical protein [Amycolatopsis sp. CA-128772]